MQVSEPRLVVMPSRAGDAENRQGTALFLEWYGTDEEGRRLPGDMRFLFRLDIEGFAHWLDAPEAIRIVHIGPASDHFTRDKTALHSEVVLKRPDKMSVWLANGKLLTPHTFLIRAPAQHWAPVNPYMHSSNGRSVIIRPLIFSNIEALGAHRNGTDHGQA